ncbi:MAG: BACON domain-containing protein [Acidobacteria bacterium]|nr:BACON domain-containing protein [Acidobacteriota bacterium]
MRGGGEFTLPVHAPEGCAWTATIDGAWIVPSATSGTGPASLTVTVGPSLGGRAQGIGSRWLWVLNP